LLLAAMGVVAGMDVVGMEAVVADGGCAARGCGHGSAEVGVGPAAVVVVAAADAQAAGVAGCGSTSGRSYTAGSMCPDAKRLKPLESENAERRSLPPIVSNC
jgi:hypothetical protein